MNSLKAFDAVARHLSISTAAGELSVTHGAVSQQIRVLERFLGRDLLIRKGNAIQLTETGEGFAKTVHASLAAISSETMAILEMPERVRLQISAPPTFAAHWLIPNLPRFHDAHPEIEVSVDVSAKVVRLRADGPHAAIRFGKSREADLEYIDVLKPSIVAVGSPAYFKRNGRVKSIKDLANHDLINGTPRSTRQASLHVTWGEVAGEAGRASVDVAEEHVALAQALDGKGLILIDEFLVRADIKSRRLRLALDQHFRAKANYRLAMPNRTAMKRHLRTFAAWLQEEFAD